VSRFLVDSGVEENAKTDSNPARLKQTRPTGKPTQSASVTAARNWPLLQLPSRCLLPLRRYLARLLTKLCRRLTVKALVLLLKLAAWRLSRRP
jgi:hypothetical protein